MAPGVFDGDAAGKVKLSSNPAGLLLPPHDSKTRGLLTGLQPILVTTSDDNSCDDGMLITTLDDRGLGNTFISILLLFLFKFLSPTLATAEVDGAVKPRSKPPIPPIPNPSAFAAGFAYPVEPVAADAYPVEPVAADAARKLKSL